MTIALFRADVAVRSYLGCKALQRNANGGQTNSCQKLSKPDSQDRCGKKKAASSGNYKKRGKENDSLETTDAARETYFSDGVANYEETQSTRELASVDSLTTSVDSNYGVMIYQGTNESTNVTIRVAGRTFSLCKCPLIARSGYLLRILSDTDEIELPSNFPGGAEIFELVVNFCNSSDILIDPSNVATLRCAAEFLEMTEEQSKHNLCERADIYLNQVVLQSWVDTLACLQTSESLLPLVEEVLVVTRCIESLAFMACIESLDFEARDGTRTVYHSSESQYWSESSSCVMNATSPVWWMAELLQIPFIFFGRIIKAFRKQRMPEKYVSLAIMTYVEEWLFGVGDTNLRLEDSKSTKLLEDVVRLLPLQTYILPVGFLFSLLRYALTLHASNDCRLHLETRIASQLELATAKDFLMPTENADRMCSASVLDCMAHIVSLFVSQHQSSSRESLAIQDVSVVANIWDAYLEDVGSHKDIHPKNFSTLLETIPAYFRADHDQLYKTISSFLKAHPQISQEERDLICRSLSCQKLSQEVCIQALRNELMPMRIVVQAMYAQHIQTRKVLHNHFRNSLAVTNEGIPHSGGLISSNIKPTVWPPRHEPYIIKSTITNNDRMQHGGSLGAKTSGNRNIAHLQATFLKADMEETNTKLQSLEEELAHLKRAFNRALRMDTASNEKIPVAGAFHGLEHAADGLHYIKSSKGIRSQSIPHPHVHKKTRVVQSVFRTVFQKIGISSFCSNRHDFEIERELNWLDNDRYELSEVGHATSCDDAVSSNSSSQMPAEGRHRHTRHYSVA
ncbi:hypothetical protein O6H91_19G007700 [Diphasiastrum complanatum]|uniref:Uncharacterized protein n=7 Tax=Diphasiastrum complanatum TaxID=34168 RepID=A0ACC2ASN0_DIPCM|nr:hypothetical protein O6H91_19G007500 [Diphasiastrum complanatum]KAJ7520475.1 hypothetical protein O6H91_19G007500 [Diphasiastrum complanatum]KAJ7520476.1 hypothetical protein O6H91_19G007500 [Diphasiastrum complanatum]KAJ7520478.1 hypothetical protein O6H91_19G007700 [Diphasiastrum complanatum]KAJ7520479.1 hypothetical protein O6H91_19G007700 [Diphasiastrum complanatum]